MSDEINWDTSPQKLLSYNSYLRVDDLLNLQGFESEPPAHDELLFIVIHQAYELWFKLILFELEAVLERLSLDDVYEATRLVQRVLTIEKLLVQQIHVLETMTPRDFLSFRRALNPASGFQSIQFREVEFVTGIRRGGVMKGIELTDEQRARLEARLSAPSLRTQFFELLQRKGFRVHVPADDSVLEGEEREQTMQELKRIYENPEKYFHIYSLCEALVEHDQNLLLWRFHHVRVVERLIGTKHGTGGSPGVKYLESTLQKRGFPMLWEVRGLLSDEAFYGTARGVTRTLDGDDVND
ncbi:MAG: tryptophan 2,3-dioxygenase family protein [bacterium]